MTFRRWLIVGLVVAVLAGLTAAQFVRRHYQQQALAQAKQKLGGPVAVTVTAVGRATIRRRAAFTGTAQALAEVRLAAKVGGRIEALALADGTPVDEGFVVPAVGVPLGQIDRATYQAQLQQAEAALAAVKAEQAKVAAGARPEELAMAVANAEGATAASAAAKAGAAQAAATLTAATADVERSRNLLRDQVVSQQQLDNAEAQFTVARERLQAAQQQVLAAAAQQAAAAAQLALVKQGARVEDRQALAARVLQAEAVVELARLSAADAQLPAPLAGVVARRHLDPGNLVTPGTPVLTLVQMDPLKVLLSVSEPDVPFIRVGQTVATLTPDADPAGAAPLTAKVFRVSPVADVQTRTVGVELRVPNAAGRLRPGMFVRVELDLEAHTDALVVPEAAIARDEGQTYVFVADGSVARRRTIVTGLSDGLVREVTQGLQAGDRVVVRGQHLLADGAAVQVAATEAGP